IEQDQALGSGVRDRHAKRGFEALGSHRGDDDGAQMIMQLRWRHHHAGSALFDLAPDRRVELDQPYLAALHHADASSSALGKSPIANTSSPRSATSRAASAHPPRTGAAGLRSTMV